MARERVLVFDVNETLLDVAGLDPLFTELTGRPELRASWFTQMLQVAFASALSGNYLDFSTAQHAALAMLARREELRLPPDAGERLAARVLALPAHDDVHPALARLRSADFRLVALTNSPLSVVSEQFRRTGLSERFDLVLSADQVGAPKPAPQPYHFAARSAGVPLARLRLVAAHGWDVSGALAAGAAAAMLHRAGAPATPVGPQPDIDGDDLLEVAARIIERDR